MKLRRLELSGFKSFADKTTLEFTPGVAVIVGPNGSGKSNLSDAIAWVLGEQGPKTLRGGKGSLAEAWVKVDADGEAWLMQAHIPEYEFGNRNNHDPVRPRKLLLHRRELDRLSHEVGAQGVTLVPTRLYFKEGRAKLEFAVGRGKNVADKRRDMAKRDAKREMERALKHRGR